RCGDRGHQIEDQGDDEQLAASEAVGELAEDDRTYAGAEDVDRAGGADVGGSHLDAAAVFGQACGDVADHRDFEAVEDPHAAETDDDHPVEAGPGQTVKAGRHIRLDRSEFDATAHQPPHWGGSMRRCRIDSPLRCLECRHAAIGPTDRKSTRLNSSHVSNSYDVFCL